MSNLNPGRRVLLFQLTGANMQLTTDQAFTKVFRGNTYAVAEILARRASGGASVACDGGIYTGASKSGNQLVAAAQSWLDLSGGNKICKPTLASSANTAEQTATPNLSLTTGSTAACTANIWIYGYVLS